MDYSSAVARPDWVILGAPTGDGKVMVLGSTEMTHAELEMEVEDAYSLDWRAPTPSYLRTTTLTAGLRTYVLVVADSYQEAMAGLFSKWSPDPGRAEVTGRRALTGD